MSSEVAPLSLITEVRTFTVGSTGGMLKLAANEVEAVLARNQGKWADEGDEMHPGNVKLEGDNDPESTEYSIDGDVPWFYISKGEETSGPRNDTMRPIVDRLNTDELRAEHEKQLSARIDEPRHHGLVHFDEEGNAWIRKSSIRFNTVVFVHGEQEASNNASTSVSAPKDIYKPSLEDLSGGSIRSQIRPMRDFDQIHHDRACQVDVLAARKSIKRRYGRRSLPRQFRAETGALERAAAWHETLELQASYDTILNAKPDWPTERRRAFDKVTAKIAKDDETLHIQEQQAATRLTARFTGSMRGTIKLIKRVAPGIPSFTDSTDPTDPTESIPLINTLYH